MEQGSSEHSHQSIQKLNHHYFLMSPMRSYEQEVQTNRFWLEISSDMERLVNRDGASPQ